MEKETFKKCMSLLSGMYGQQKNEKVLVYWELFKDRSNEEFEIATKSVIKTFSPTNTCPFPVPAKFFEAFSNSDVGGVIDTIKGEVHRVGHVDNPEFNNPAIDYVIASFGGWHEVCSWTIKDWQINSPRIKESYKSALINGKTTPNKPVSRFFLENRGREEKKELVDCSSEIKLLSDKFRTMA